MAEPLLNRQVRLLEYLTGGGAIFGGEGASLDPALRGIDRRLLHIEARFSHEKRMEKIAAVFPRTLALLGNGRDALVRAFAESCPPTDISRIENARQFHGFLAARWRSESPQPGHLPDVAACELACASMRADADQPEPAATTDAPRHGVRRHRDIALLRCGYDIRPVLEDRDGGSLPDARTTHLALALDSDSGEPRLLELAPEVFDLLAALDRWIDPWSDACSDPWSDLWTGDGTQGAAALFAELERAGLVEVRR